MLAEACFGYHLSSERSFMLFTLFFEYLFYSSKEFRSLIHIDFHRLFYDACCSIFNELSALWPRLSDRLSATACILYHTRFLLSTLFFNFFAIFFGLWDSLICAKVLLLFYAYVIITLYVFASKGVSLWLLWYHLSQITFFLSFPLRKKILSWNRFLWM